MCGCALIGLCGPNGEEVDSITSVHCGLALFFIEPPHPPTQKGSRSSSLGRKNLLTLVTAVISDVVMLMCVFCNFRMESTEKCDAVISHFNGKFIKTPAGVPGKT